MPCIPLHPLLDVVQCIYIEGRWTPSQLSIDALHTTTPTARSRPPSQSSTDVLYTTTPTARCSTMHIYRNQMDSQSINHRCLAYCYTHCQIYTPPGNQAQMPCIPLHPLLDIVQCIYIEGTWTPKSIKYRCLAYCYTHC